MTSQISDEETSNVADGYDGLFCHTLSDLAWADWTSRDSMTNIDANL
jgi:hypothetical protein